MSVRAKRLLAAGALWALLAAPPVSAGGRQVLILADVSGSMREEITFMAPKENSEEKEKKRIRKVEAVKELMLRMKDKPELFDSPVGVYQIRHLAGNPVDWDLFLEPALHGGETFADAVQDGFETDYPVFNRRTPLADALNQIHGDVLQNAESETILVIFSDGKESFYDLEEDAEKSFAAAEAKQDDPTTGPLSETVRIARSRSGKLRMHTVYMEESENPYEPERLDAFFGKDETEMKQEVDGEMLLKRMARAGGGTGFSAKRLLEDAAYLETFLATLCGGRETGGGQ